MAKFVRKLNRDESGYHYEEVKSSVTPKKESKVKLKIRDILSGIKSGSLNSTLSDAIADATSVRNEAFKNAKAKMSKSIITGVTEIPEYPHPKVIYDEKNDTYTVNGHMFTAEAFADLYNSGGMGYVSCPANMEPIVSTGQCGVKGVDGANGDDVEYCISGSIDVSKLDDDFYPTASCGEPIKDVNAFHNIDTQPVIDMITTKKYREDGGARLRKLAGLPPQVNIIKPIIHGKIIIK